MEYPLKTQRENLTYEHAIYEVWFTQITPLLIHSCSL